MCLRPDRLRSFRNLFGLFSTRMIQIDYLLRKVQRDLCLQIITRMK
eukprot:UN24529